MQTKPFTKKKLQNEQPKNKSLNSLLSEVHSCAVCESHLPMGARPVLMASEKSKILVIGQAPGIRVHNTGIPWNDPSGERLRQWLNVDKTQFYDTSLFAIIPMGFCYPGTGKSGDLPPRKECAPLWHPPLFSKLPSIKLTLLIGNYAQRYYLGKNKKSNLTETVQYAEEYLPKFFPLPHPSPRNNIWLKRNPWFEKHNLPTLESHVKQIINAK